MTSEWSYLKEGILMHNCATPPKTSGLVQHEFNNKACKRNTSLLVGIGVTDTKKDKLYNSLMGYKGPHNYS